MSTVLLARVSTDDQADRGTIENQIEFGMKYCDLHQISLQGIYKDDGISGTIPLPERPEGFRLMEDAASGKIKTVLVYKLDRLGRTARVILNAIYDLEQYGVQIRSMTEPFDTSSPAGRFALTILAGVADLDRTSTLERLWHGANRWAREGKWLGGIVPYGYVVNEAGYLQVNDNIIDGLNISEADVIRNIYDLITSRKLSTIKIADHLNDLSIPTSYIIHKRQLLKGKRKEKTSGKWTPGRIRNMIVNSTYMGIHHYGKRSKKSREIITREVPAIISKETWEQAQQILKDNMIEATRNTKKQYLLRSLLKCNCCGLNYCGTSYPTGKTFYICNGKTTYRGKYNGKCPAKNISADLIESLVWSECVKLIRTPMVALAEFNINIAEGQASKSVLEAEQKSLIETVRAKDSEKQKLIDLFRKNLIDSTDVENHLSIINSEKQRLTVRIKELERLINKKDNQFICFDSMVQYLIALNARLYTDNPPFELKREILRSMIRKIVIETKNPEDARPQILVAIHYRFVKDVDRTDKDSLPQLERS